MLSLVMLLALQQQPAQAPVAFKVRYRFDSNTETAIDAAAMKIAMKTMLSGMLQGITGQDSIDMAKEMADMDKELPEMTPPPVKSMVTFTMIARDSAGGKVAHITIDSASTDQFAKMQERMKKATGDIPAGRSTDSLSSMLQNMMKDAMKSAKGETVDLFALDGKVMDMKVSDAATAEMAIMMEALKLLFPPMKTGTTVGQSWVDTVKVDSTISVPMLGDMQPKSNTVTKWKMITKNSFEGEQLVSNTVEMGEQLGSGQTDSKGKTRIVLDNNRFVVEAGASTSTSIKVSMPMFGGAGIEMSTYVTTALKRVP